MHEPFPNLDRDDIYILTKSIAASAIVLLAAYIFQMLFLTQAREKAQTPAPDVRSEKFNPAYGSEWHDPNPVSERKTSPK